MKCECRDDSVIVGTDNFVRLLYPQARFRPVFSGFLINHNYRVNC